MAIYREEEKYYSHYEACNFLKFSSAPLPLFHIKASASKFGDAWVSEKKNKEIKDKLHKTESLRVKKLIKDIEVI